VGASVLSPTGTPPATPAASQAGEPVGATGGPGKRLLVTGGAGFIGSTFVRRRLASTNDHVTVVDKLTYAGNPANLAGLDDDPATRHRYRFVKADIADEPLMKELAREVDAIVNFAAESHVDRSILEPAAFLLTGVMGVYSLLEAARAEQERRGHGFRLLQVSTDEVYGPVPEGSSVETDPMRPTSPYSAAKAAGEHLVAAYHETHGLDTIITRGANTYGPHQYPEKLIPLFITNALDDEPLPMYGDGKQRRDWLFVADHADGIGVALDRGTPGAAYNIPGDGVERPNRAVTEAILGALGKPWSLVRRVPDRPGHDRRYALDGSRLRALGWEPRVSFEEGLALTLEWYSTHRDWWEPIKRGDWADFYRAQYAWRLEESVEA
jgi:dTDP-glucose 4,6-dehydratase